MWMKTGGAVVGAMPLFWCSIIIGLSLTWSCNAYKYEKRTLDKFDGQSYDAFIKGLRSWLPKAQENGKEFKKFNIPVLLKKQDVKDQKKRFVLVDLKSSDVNVVTLVLHAPDVYMCGFVVKDTYYQFQDADVIDKEEEFFKKSVKKWAQMRKGTYDQIEGRTGGKTRKNTDLGVLPLKKAVTVLAENPADIKKQAQSLLVIIQMVSEAARYTHFLDTFKNPDYASAATLSMISYENNWINLSKQIILADSVTSDFKEEVIMQGDQGERIVVKKVNDPKLKLDLREKLALLKDTDKK